MREKKTNNNIKASRRVGLWSTHVFVFAIIKKIQNWLYFAKIIINF